MAFGMGQGRFEGFNHQDDWPEVSMTDRKRQTVREVLSGISTNLKRRLVRRSRTIRARDGGDIQVYETVQE